MMNSFQNFAQAKATPKGLMVKPIGNWVAIYSRAMDFIAEAMSEAEVIAVVDKAPSWFACIVTSPDETTYRNGRVFAANEQEAASKFAALCAGVDLDRVAFVLDPEWKA